MSWDADLFDLDGDVIDDWNYTHNTNCMANVFVTAEESKAAAMRSYANRPEVLARIESGENIGGSWWSVLDGMTAQDGAVFLERLIDGLQADPERFRAMNPDNGWGDYDSFLGVLKEMCGKSAKKTAASWRCSG